MYLYQDLNRPLSTIDDYRMAIVNTLGPVGLHISQSSDLNRLLSSFHRDHPKSSRNLPKWNLSVVLNELTKAPFEPQTSYTHNCFLASFGLRQVLQRNSCLGCKQNILSKPVGKGSFVPLFRFHSQKPTSKRRFSNCVSCKRVLIPTLISFKKGHTPDIRPATLSS